MPVEFAEVFLWGERMGVGAVSGPLTVFEYDRDFLSRGVEPAPIMMPARPGVYQFPELVRSSFEGTPGLLSDSLPDRFGNRLIDLWLAREGRSAESVTVIEKLCFVGTRGMGALEFRPPATGISRSETVDIDALAETAVAVLAGRVQVSVPLDDDGLTELIRVGSSAGGARAKALIAWNPATNEVRSGQAGAPDGFEHWILKFDGVGSSDHEAQDPVGFGRVENAYHLMALECGIEMPECRLFVDRGGRGHFMARRFDRTPSGEKLHMQSLSALGHLDFTEPGRHSYEDAFRTILRLELAAPALAEMYRRMAFNVVARNQDDHTKNLAFLMNRDGEWRLAPAFDVIWAYNPQGAWTNRHQMTIAGKADGFEASDLLEVGRAFGVRDASGILDRIVEVVAQWNRFCEVAAVESEMGRQIGATHRLLR